MHYAQKDQVLRIPNQAIVRVDQDSYVFIANDNKAQRVKITTGIRENGWIEVIDGISEGTPVIVTGQNTLRDDATIEVIQL